MQIHNAKKYKVLAEAVLFILMLLGFSRVIFLYRKWGVHGVIFDVRVIFLIFCLFYLTLPYLLARPISAFGAWDFKNQIIIEVQIYALWWTFIFFIATFVDGRFGYTAHRARPRLSWVSRVWLRLVLATSIFICLYVANIIFHSDLGGQHFGNHLHSTVESMRPIIKNIAYLNIIPIALLATTRKIIDYLTIYLFILLVVYIDLAHGQRTTAFISISSGLCAYLYAREKPSIKPVLIALLGVYLLAIYYRDSMIAFDGIFGTLISLLGEFRETSIPLLFAKTYNTETSYSSLELILYISNGVLGFMREAFVEDIKFPGVYLADQIGRGYGFGFSAPTEAFYYFGDFGLVVFPIALALMGIGLNILKSGFSIGNKISFSVFVILWVRLGFREGFIQYSSLFLYLTIICWVVCRLPSIILEDSKGLRCVLEGTKK